MTLQDAVSDIMSTPVVTVEMDDSLRQVRHIFGNTHFHHLLVAEEQRLVGIISDRDLFKAISPRSGTPVESSADAALLNKKVHQIMTRKPITVTDTDNIGDAWAALEQHGLSCLPVVNAKGKPVGIISWRDILAAARNIIRDSN